jgi:hypothetical protein
MVGTAYTAVRDNIEVLIAAVVVISHRNTHAVARP